MTRDRLALLTLALLLPASQASAQLRHHETIVVSGSAAPSELGEVGRPLAVIEAEEISRLAVTSVADALRLAPGVQVGARGESGMQSDFSLRGATFAQTLVLVDGVRVNDAQTGHHNGDIPVPLEDIERIEILYGPASALHGADAFGGTIHVVTRRSRKGGSARLAAGSFGYVDGAVSLRTPGEAEARSVGITLAGKRSDGFVAHRDYRGLEGRVDAALSDATRLSLAHLDKEFGAAGFYGPAPSREWTRQSLASFDHALGLGTRAAGSLQAHLRLHRDRFLYDVERPELSDNRHRTGSAGVSFKAHRQLAEAGRLSLGGEVGGDWIDSTSLGRDGYARGSAFVELRHVAGGVTLTPGLRVTGHQGFAPALSPSLAAAGSLTDSLRWRGSVGHAYRVPTFTELRYHDPNHAASDGLQPERAWGLDGGLDLATRGGWHGSLSLFGRWDDSVIDWVRPDPAERWTTANIRDVRTLGLELSSGWAVGERLDLGLHYAYVDSRTPALDLQSKYLLDFARHSAGARMLIRLPGGFDLGQHASFRRHVDGRDAWLLDLRVGKSLGAFVLYAEGRNLLDSRTHQIRGVEVPGRSLAFGMRAALR